MSDRIDLTPGTPLHSLFGTFGLRPTVKVLFYTDDSDLVNLESNVHLPENDFGVRMLRDLVESDQSHRPIMSVDLVDRHDGGHAARKLLPKLLDGYDEVWFFGIEQANVENQLENELTDPEVQALESWMAAGGVLMTGDHANPRPARVLDHSLNGLLGLGRAIAHRVPRAGQLRSWEGNPGIEENQTFGTFSFNTQVPAGDTEIFDLALQEDERPQTLILKTFPVAGGNPILPSFHRRVHPLFCGATVPVTIFPDHMHEGRLVIPASLPAAVWPSGPDGQPRPEVIAKGTDKRNGEIYDIVIAYDGRPANVGRIVADSTWHHYFNVNLRGFLGASPVLPRLADYYRNLTEWLAPPAKRAAIARWRLLTVLQNPSVVMATGNSLRVVGDVATNVLRKSIGPCAIAETVTALLANALPAGLSELPPNVALGGIVAASLRTLESYAPGKSAALSQVVVEGIAAAYDEYISGLDDAVSRARAERQSLKQRQVSG